MKALVLGAGGQVGRALARLAPSEAELIALGHGELDITDAGAVRTAVRETGAGLVFNAAAYTAVDKAESEPELARAINATAVGHLADAARQTGAKLIHISTDFVFAGDAGSPYPTDGVTAPLGVYGKTKLEGELRALENAGALVVRTAWVYDQEGKNFVNTMLRFMAERDELTIVADQIGSPTLADDLAEALWALALKDAAGVRHFTNSGVASWYDFAVAIEEEARIAGRLDRAVAIRPIRTIDFPTPARRPAYSVLDCSATNHDLDAPARHWRTALRSILKKSET